AGNVQVAVVEGKVSLKKEGAKESASALLTRNNFGLLDLDDSSITIEQVHAANYKSWASNHLVYSGESLAKDSITIEQVHAANYKSWASNHLVYSGESLAKVSRQLERLYDAKISFATADLKKLKLTADFERNNLETTIQTIANTFDIQYRINGRSVTWIE